MSVKIRLSRRGRKKLAIYDVVIADSRSPRDGKFIEKIGTYDPNADPAAITLNDEKAFDWVMKGAQPTETVRAMLSYRGIMFKKHLQIGVNKSAITQEEADKRLEAWMAEKESKIQGKIDKLSKDKSDKAKARLEAEKKVSDARAESIVKRKKVAEEALTAEIVEASADESEKALEEEGNEAVVETQAKTEETPAVEANDETPKVEEAPKAEEPVAGVVEEAPMAEEKTEQPVAEAAEEAPKAEEKVEDADTAEKPEEEDKKEG